MSSIVDQRCCGYSAECLRSIDSSFKMSEGSASLPNEQNSLPHRSKWTDKLRSGILDPHIVFARASTYQSLGYADLAAADAYVVLTLAETGLDPDFSDLEPQYFEHGECVPWPPNGEPEMAVVYKVKALEMLISCLADLGCLRDAYSFYLQLKEFQSDLPTTISEPDRLRGLIIDHHLRSEDTASQAGTDASLESMPQVLANSGFARRVVYPWNDHEPDRSSSGNLDELKERLKLVAPDLEVRSTALPVLHNLPTSNDDQQSSNLLPDTMPSQNSPAVSVQLGLFASKDFPPSAHVLHERSLLTATRTLHDSLCDACAAVLPDISSPSPPVACADCADSVFCSQTCHDLAEQSYHPTICGNEDGLEDIGRDPASKAPSDDLYFLLVARVIAMAEQRQIHPLAMPEVKYLWGDFLSPTFSNDMSAEAGDTASSILKTLPFSFQHNIVLPFRLFSTLMISRPECSPYGPHHLEYYDPWVIQTLYAKFRGVASARQSTWDGKPEVAAVHPMWCLANHSCSPNVAWEWSGEIVYTVRESEVWNHQDATAAVSKKSRREEEEEEEEEEDTKDEDEENKEEKKRQPPARKWTGIKKGQEIFNHYCDIRLPVQERREWMKGSLGGDCQCERCEWESRKA